MCAARQSGVNTGFARVFAIVASALLVLTSAASSHAAEFVPGDVYVAESSVESCGNPPGRIYRIDPVSGESSIFAQIPISMCGFLFGLAFTPDGSKLRAS